MKKIIIADDSATMRLLIRMCLRDVHGIDITESSDGLEAMEKIRNEHFDLLITDLNMPHMDGLKLIENVRLMGLHMPIIILTTHGDETEIKKGLMLGANDYLTKPISGYRFNALIHNYVDSVV
jgi:two-component system chemotaxis response regulator CheY